MWEPVLIGMAYFLLPLVFSLIIDPPNVVTR